MTPATTPDQPQPASRQRLLHELNVLAQVAQAQCDAIPQRRFRLLFSPKAHLRAIMLRHVLELLAVLASAFAAPAEPPIPSDAAVAYDTGILANTATPNQATAAIATVRRVTTAEPVRPHPIVSRMRQIRALGTTSRPASPPQRAGAAPNPNPNSIPRERRNAPHRPLTPGAATQRPPQRLRQAARTL